MVNTSKARDHGLGHVQLELRRGYDSELAWLGTRREKVPEYVTALEESYGEAKAKEVLWDGPPHALIFPNLFLGEMNLAIIFISHDLSVVKHVSDKVAVMYFGKVVESGSAKEIYANPQHDYTKKLLAAIPINHPKYRKKKRLAEKKQQVA